MKASRQPGGKRARDKNANFEGAEMQRKFDSAIVRPGTPEGKPRTTRDLTDAERALVALIRKYQFGRIENVIVSEGQPILDRDVKVVRVAHLGGNSAGTRVPSSD